MSRRAGTSHDEFIICFADANVAQDFGLASISRSFLIALAGRFTKAPGAASLYRLRPFTVYTAIKLYIVLLGGSISIGARKPCLVPYTVGSQTMLKDRRVKSA